MKKIDRDFEDFMNSSTTPPLELSDRILARVKADLEPSQTLVFFKTVLIYAVSSLITLTFCPQFGFRIYGDGPGLMGYLMKFGNGFCMGACGFIFLGMSALAHSILLTQFELKTFRKYRFVYLPTLIGFSLAFFAINDAEIAFKWVISWVVGSVIGAFLFHNIGILFKEKIKRISFSGGSVS